jgi:hypothetical protein
MYIVTVWYALAILPMAQCVTVCVSGDQPSNKWTCLPLLKLLFVPPFSVPRQDQHPFSTGLGGVGGGHYTL